MPIPEKSLANLRPQPFTSEKARQAGIKSGEARRKRAQERKQAEELDLRSKAYKRLTELLDGPDKQFWQAAIREALDRTEGKPTQRVETAQVEARPLAELSQEELLERARQAGLPVLGEHAREPGVSSIPKAQSENP